ncbi:metallophosphoesterase [Ideonella sp.]|uniref:metallophosphoesterase n=1 Tax=Ideonella sp. TaxID=1929293 RepID=UPI002B46AAC1|nr:metallophosphoesterase [Ideonella sp.]HJV71038.1 metallophosphoesterase [Ideonella sp.]
MRLQLASDLHLERHPNFALAAAPGADTLVLAGDVGSYQAGSRLDDADEFGLARFAPGRPGAPWQRVLYVPGNHEYDGLEFDDAHARLRAACDRLGITWLEREVLVIDGVRFIGTTLWTDFEALAQREPTMTLQMQARDKAYRAANFYLRRFTATLAGAPMLAEQWRDMGLECQRWLRDALAEPFDTGPTVVVTHYAPSLRSADPRYGLTPGTAGFCNALDGLFERADLWLHGHLHCPSDYRAGPGQRCRVVANPLGYANKGEQEGFQPLLAIDVPAAAA